MTAGARVLFRPGEVATAALLVALALSVALVIGNPGVSGIPVLVIALTAIASAIIVSQFYAGYLVMVVCCFILVVVAVTPERNLNVFDLLLPLMFPAALLGSLRRDAQLDEQVNEAGPDHDRIRIATRRFVTAVIVYYSIAAVSLIHVVFSLGFQSFTILAFAFARTIEGTLMFPLGLWWIRSERRIHHLIVAVSLGGLFLVAFLLGARMAVGTTRPGTTWIVNDFEHPTTDPNQAGLTTALLMAFIFAQYALRFRIWKYLAVIASIMILVLSQSRSGVVATALFLVLAGKRVRVHHILLGLVAIGLGLVLAPQDYRSRLFKTITLHRGSTELYTWMIRVYGYVANIRAFLDNWLFGTGFLAGGFVSPRYNPLALTLPGADNYYLETAVGLGVIGLAALTLCFVRMFQLGRVVRQVTPEGSLGRRLAEYHAPLIAAIMVANLTGDNLVGLVANAQLAVWCAVLVRGGHLSLRAARVPSSSEGDRLAHIPLGPIEAQSPA